MFRRQLIYTMLSLCVALVSHAGAKIDYRYWFDHDTLATNTGHSEANAWQKAVDVSSLDESIHAIHLQAVIEDSVSSNPVTRYFLKTKFSSKPVNVVYWVDMEQNPIATSKVTNGTVQLDVDVLPEGFHYLHVQAQGEVPSQPKTYCFCKVPNESSSTLTSMNCICKIDGEQFWQETLPANDGLVSWELDVSQLPQGIHMLQVQVIGSNGYASRVYQSFFYRIPTQSEHSNMSCRYSIDGGEMNLLASTINNGIYHFDLDVADLDEGPHKLTLMMRNDKGTSTRYINRYFVKIPLGGSGVKRYQYWLNDSLSQAVDVAFDSPVDPFNLISLLPFDHWPVRSSSFEFKVENGNPVIYACNDMHIRFFDVTERFIEMKRTFTDPVVKEDVTDITLLQPGETKTAQRPQENEIIWYKVDALHGDSLSFKADRPCTIQVFSPTGEQLRSALGDKSVKWCGIHAPKDGTYYIAQHDMTATQGNTLAISYQHIDQYAVLDYDVHTVGNGGASIITYNGNGFDDLYAIDIFNHQGDTIHHQNFRHKSNGVLEGYYDFYGYPEGDYDALFSFVEGELLLPNALHIEAPKGVVLETEVKYPSSFFWGRYVTYKLTIKNKGNMTAFAVPINVSVITDRDDISHIKITGLDLDQLLQFDYQTELEEEQLKETLAELGDDYHFAKYWKKNDIGTDSSLVRRGIFITSIAPYSTKTISFSFKSSANVNALFSVADTLNAIVTSATHPDFERTISERERGKTSWYCCHLGDITCALGMATEAATIANVIGAITGAGAVTGTISCIVSIANDLNGLFGAAACGQKAADMTGWEKIKMAMSGFSFFGSLFSCASSYIPIQESREIVEVATTGYSLIVGNAITLNGCGNLGCENVDSVCPNSCIGGPAVPYYPIDPNEMLGYTAPSGSHHIGNGHTDVNYTICFENDTAATAPANVIVLTDTIDSNLFELNTFAPTRIRIGDVEAQLSGLPNFIQTVDMRPRINCIAQVECNYDSQQGIATWTLSSLDPMTLEPITDFYQGLLPVNYDGNGQGEVSYDISLKQGLPEGTQIKNHATITFDSNEPITTPDWVNIIDGVKPTSRVIDCELLNDSVAAVSIRGEDDRSGPWHYDIYTQYGGGDWYKTASEVPIDRAAHVHVYEGIEHHFYAVLTDSAGNVEEKQPAIELTFDYFSSDTESNLTLNLEKGWNWMSHNLNTPLSVDAFKPNAYRIMSHNGETIKDPRYGYTGTVSQLLPTELYKVEMTNADNIQLSGKLFNSALKPVPLVKGWNWMGYPMPGTMSVNEALISLEADENDCIVGQDGTAVYNDGLWRGTLTTLEPGKGYLLKVNSDRPLRFNVSRSSVRLHAPMAEQDEELPWMVNIHRYPNVTPVIADLWDGYTLTSSIGYALAAFVDDECRGIASEVNGRWMMNVYGRGGETVTFKALDRSTGLVHDVTETETFTADLLGTMALPVQLHIAEATGMSNVTYDAVNVTPTLTTGPVTIKASAAIDAIEVINLDGVTVMGYNNIPSGYTLDLGNEPDGVYLIRVHTGSHISIVKVMKRSR